MPGYAALQQAHPVTLGHALLAHFWPLARDHRRLADCFERANVSPLGAGALAGSTPPTDPTLPPLVLGFAAPFENSIDAVSARAYFPELLLDPSLLSAPLSPIP